MAEQFHDDFNRADGAPGNGWTVAGTVVVATNQLAFHSSGAYAYRTVSAGQEYDVQAKVITGPDQSWPPESGRMQLWLRSDGTFTQGYVFEWWGGATGTAAVRLLKKVAGVTTTLTEVRGLDLSSGTHTLTARCQGNILTVDVDGTTVLWWMDGMVASGSVVRLYSFGNNVWHLNDYWEYDVSAARMYVIPQRLLVGEEGIELQLIGINTAWSAGTPGDPEFTADAGTITAQTVDDAILARLTYDAPATPQTVVITDPDTGREAHLLVVADVGEPPDSGPFTDWLWRFLAARLAGIDIILEYLGYSQDWNYIGRIVDELGVTADEAPTDGRLKAVQAAIEGITATLGEDTEDPDSVRHLLGSILDSAVAGHASTLYISSNGTIDLQQVLTAIAAIEPGDGDIGEAIDDLTTLCTTILAELYLIDGMPTARNTILDVLEAIAALEVPDMGELETKIDSILSKVDALDGDGSTNLPAILAETQAAHSDASTAATQASAAAISAAAAVVAIGLVEGSILAAITAATAEVNAAIGAATVEVNGAIGALGEALALDIAGVSSQVTTVQETLTTMDGKLDQILAALAAIQNQEGKWPGIAGVTNIETTYIGESTHVSRPCDGALLDLMTYPQSRVYWTTGAATNLQYVGFLQFVGANGYMDDRQPIAFTHQAYRPISVRRPVGVVVRLQPGVTAQVSTWDYA